MKIANHSIDYPLTTVMLIVGMLFLGYISLIGLPIDLFPQFDLPLVTVSTVYPGASPSEVEKLITKKIEESVTSIESIKELQSASHEGNSLVVIQFEWGVDIDLKAIDVKDKVELVQSALPDDAEKPIISKFNILNNTVAIMLSASSKKTDFSRELADIPEAEREEKQKQLKEKELQKTRKFVEDKVKDRLERIKGVASATIIGGLQREILVSVRPSDLNSYGLSLDDITKTLKDANINLPGGHIKEKSTEFTVRGIGEFENISDIENIIVKNVDGKAVYLKYIADIIDTHKEVREHSRTNGADAVGIQVIKRTGGNSVQIADAVKKEIEALNKDFTSYNIAVSVDYSQYIKDSIGMVKNNAVIGGILSTIVLLLFLKNFKSTLIIAMTMPTALVVTFFLVAQKEMTLNLLSLGGLALGVGMLVDNSIVILENIYRHLSMGKDPIEGTKEAAHEVGVALAGSTYTTLAVFIPIIFFTTGIVHEIFSDLAYTVTFSIAASLLVAVTFVPMAASRMLRLKVKATKNENSEETKLSEEKSKAPLVRKESAQSNRKVAIWLRFLRLFSIERMQNLLESMLRPMLKRRYLTILVSIGAIAASGILMKLYMKQEFFPKQDEGVFSVTMELGTGRSLEQTDKKTALVEERISKIPENILENFFVTVNTGNKPNESMVGIKLVKKDNRNVSTTQIVDKVRSDLLKIIPGAKITVTEGEQRGPGGKPVELIIKGDDLEKLTESADKVAKMMSGIEGAVDVDTSLRMGKPEVRYKINWEKASDLKLTADNISSGVRKWLTGEVATTFKELDDEIDMRVKIDRADDLKVEDVAGLLIPVQGGKTVRLEEVSDVYEDKGPVVLERKDQQRMAKITANLKEGYVLGQVTEKVEEEMKKMTLPKGQSYEFSGSQKDMEEAFASLFISIGIGIILVYMILVSQFESLMQPFVIMVTLPQGFVGVVLACVITGRSLSIMVMLGILILIGIVVNNAIVLLSYYNQVRKTGLERTEALVLASRTRLRPILMTTLTTSLGMLPLALGIGSGAEFYSPLAIAIIGGMLVSTLGTLFICPVLDTIAEDFGAFISRKFSRLSRLAEGLFSKIFFGKKREELED